MARILYKKIETGTKMNKKFLLGIVSLCVVFGAGEAHAASLSVNPPAGTLVVGNTFDVSLFLDTQGQTINAVEVSLRFPPDKLQLVSPSTGQSIISIWTAQPRFNNQTGRIDLQGGTPGGINVSNGLVTTLTFRVKSVGNAILRFLDNSSVLLHDGRGTDVLEQKRDGIFQFILPPPAGPIVVSETHPDQSVWYPNPHIVFRWESDVEVESYSYILNEEPVDLPDDIAEGKRTSVTYQNVADGIHYFHIKALRDGGWGGSTHFAVNTDTTPPAEFPLEVIPSSKTTSKQPLVQFNTTDRLSGTDHYELKLIPLKLQKIENPKNPQGQPLFIEAESPYILPPLELGTYDIMVRAYDKAGNYREVIQHLQIVSQMFQIVRGEGIKIRNVFVIPWIWLWVGAGVILFSLLSLAWSVRRWHHRIAFQKTKRELPGHIKKQLGELRRYRKRYGDKLLLFFLILSGILFANQQILAQQIELAPPLVTTISRNISNEEIFYIGGKTDAPQTQVIIYLQNLQTGETLSENVTSDKRRDWFYRHHTFLSSGNYLLWVQSKIGDQVSPPSPQIQMAVQPTAIQFGSSRLSYETIYGGISIVLFLALLGLTGYILFHGYHGRKKHIQFIKEMREAQEAIRRGFAVLRRDIEAELVLVRKAKLTKSLSAEEKIQEEQLRKDLAQVEQYISKEVLDIWETEHTD